MEYPLQFDFNLFACILIYRIIKDRMISPSTAGMNYCRFAAVASRQPHIRVCQNLYRLSHFRKMDVLKVPHS
jgi:hypothetical protein